MEEQLTWERHPPGCVRELGLPSECAREARVGEPRQLNLGWGGPFLQRFCVSRSPLVPRSGHRLEKPGARFLWREGPPANFLQQLLETSLDLFPPEKSKAASEMRGAEGKVALDWEGVCSK
ncbi:hypothetical protein HJG60_007804 [Phyllostomus discolor]|uniref:Uncharacterized protein n=1 Tax=Phyllostomus discolor TaxID=89673 RepID=A0A834BHB2_9CHIR|nr:hypothetical protein HJG60_007804 [Phyllostomus discolor]